MINPQQKKYFKGCGVSMRPRSVFSYPKNHPCHGCPYVFAAESPSCTMGGTPGDCAWYFYRRLTAKSKPPRPVNYAAIKAIDDCIETLYQFAGRKYGREYAENLRQRRTFPHENKKSVL